MDDCVGAPVLVPPVVVVAPAVVEGVVVGGLVVVELLVSVELLVVGAVVVVGVVVVVELDVEELDVTEEEGPAVDVRGAYEPDRSVAGSPTAVPIQRRTSTSAARTAIGSRRRVDMRSPESCKRRGSGEAYHHHWTAGPHRTAGRN